MTEFKLRMKFKVFLSAILLILISESGFATETETWKQSNNNNQVAIDHSIWQKILHSYLVTNHPSGVNRFRYKDVSNSDKYSLEKYLADLQKVDPRQYQRDEQKAFWINLYNALTVNLILENYPVTSIKKIGHSFFSFGPWDDEITKIADQPLTLNDIEHKILRPIWKDPRVHYAVNCASYGCPNLSGSTYTRDNIEALLDQGAKDYINHERGVRLNQRELMISNIYHWYKQDFGGNDKTLLAHLKQYAKPELKKALENFNGSIDHDYKWSLNEAP